MVRLVRVRIGGKKMKKCIGNQAGFGKVGVIIAVIVVVAVLAAIFIFKFRKAESIKIGAVLSLSGPGKGEGTGARNGMVLAVDEINSRGGINGREIELIIEDSQTNPEEGKEAFSKIESTHHPDLYVSTLSSVSLALAPMAEKKKVILVGLVVSSPKLTQKNKWIFRFWPTAEVEVQTGLSVLQELEVKNLGILHQNDAYGTSVFELLKKGFEKTGGTVISEGFNMKTSDFKTHIAKLKDNDAIFSVGFGFHLKNVFRQLKEENFKGFILSTNGAADAPVRSLPEANGVYLSSFIIYNPNYLFAKEAKKKYEARFSKPFNPYAANGFDFIKLLASLLEDKKVARQNVKNLLDQGFMYPGVFGDIRLKPDEHDIHIPLHPARIENGKIKYRE